MTLLDILESEVFHKNTSTSKTKSDSTSKTKGTLYAMYDATTQRLYVKPSAFTDEDLQKKGITAFLDSHQYLGPRGVVWQSGHPSILCHEFDLTALAQNVGDVPSAEFRITATALAEAVQTRKKEKAERKEEGTYKLRKRHRYLLQCIAKNEYRLSLNLYAYDRVRTDSRSSEVLPRIEGSGVEGDTYLRPSQRGIDPIGLMFKRNGPGYGGKTHWYAAISTTQLREWEIDHVQMLERMDKTDPPFNYKEDARFLYCENRTIDGKTLHVAVFDMTLNSEGVAKRDLKTPTTKRSLRRERMEERQRIYKEKQEAGLLSTATTLEEFLLDNKKRRQDVWREDNGFLFIIKRELDGVPFDYKRDYRYICTGVKYFKKIKGSTAGVFYCACFRIS